MYPIQHNHRWPWCVQVALVIACGAVAAPGQLPDPASEKPLSDSLPKITIASDPQTIDPVEVLPKSLAVRATADFSNSSLRELVKWLREDLHLVVLLDKRALAEEGIVPAEPISDRVQDEPVYLVLSRLSTVGIAWHYRDGIIHLTAEEQGGRLVTMSHDASRLLQQGFSREALQQVIYSTITPESWSDRGAGGDGTLSFLGDVMFVKQHWWQQMEIDALLKALLRPSERCFVMQPQRHLEYLKKLEQNADVSFNETAFDDALEQLGRQVDIDIRVDVRGLAADGIHIRQPVTLAIQQRKLRTILDAMLLEFELAWGLKDGTLWITTPDRVSQARITAVYDVRDLCRDAGESEALMYALTEQTDEEYWEETGDGEGCIVFARPGIMVVYATQRAHDDVLTLLRSYRHALTMTKPRKKAVLEDELATIYYRVPADVAKSLAEHLPELVGREQWNVGTEVEGVGKILHLASDPKYVKSDTDIETVVPYDVLVIRHMRSVHHEIRSVIDRVRAGDLFGDSTAGGMGGGGFGGGGFGGGMLERLDRAPPR